MRNGSTSFWRQGSRGRGPRGQGAMAAVSVAGAACLLLAGCQASSGSGSPSGSSGGGSTSSAPAADGPKVTISPVTGAKSARTDRGITVTTDGGTLTAVTAAVGGQAVPGTMNSAKTRWHSTWALSPAQRYSVTAKATDSDGHATTQTSSFRTLTPAQTFRTQIFEGYHKTYGVGMPIMLTFSEPITNKAAVERAMQITTSKPVVGAWYWDGDKTLNFRPRSYWPAHTKVTFTGHLDGVKAGPGLYGTHTLTQSFTIGRSLIVVASTSSHHMKLYSGKKLLHRWAISTGKPGDNTPNGTYLTIEKGNPVLMKGPGYKLEVPWSVRLTWSGIYLHDAFWSTGEQGFSNVSHGCINMAPANAEEYYKMEIPGDPVTVVGSPRPGVWDNGWTEWFLSWEKYVKGSALHQAVQAGPDGSTFVDPASLPASTANAPLEAPPSGNFAAS
jgi:lipoprotein-anchoring transpeptidase ErfK/SrfK